MCCCVLGRHSFPPVNACSLKMGRLDDFKATSTWRFLVSLLRDIDCSPLCICLIYKLILEVFVCRVRTCPFDFVGQCERLVDLCLSEPFKSWGEKVLFYELKTWLEYQNILDSNKPKSFCSSPSFQ